MLSCVVLVLFLCCSWVSHTHAASEKIASWYSTEVCRKNPTKGCKTADGTSLYRLERDRTHFAATWAYPFGTKLRVCNAVNGKCIVVTVRDRGPNKRLGRAIDLSKSAFSAIGDLKAGLIKVRIIRL